MAISFPSPLSKPERLTMITPLHSPRRDPPSKKRRVEGHALLFSIRKKVRWLVLHQLYKGKSRPLLPRRDGGCHGHLPPFFPLGVR